jgi:hypothetical protein
MLMTFLTILAWALLALSALTIGFRFYGAMQTRTQREMDVYVSQNPIRGPVLLLVICGAFLLAKWLT